MNKKYILPGAFAILMMASCADEFDPEFVAQKPANLEKMAELAEFQPLKEYIDRSAHPDFKLGAALSAPDFSKKLTEYNVAVTNFDEVVAGNAMKYASCVDDKGNMDFGTVNTFVLDAVDAGITVYGHTLAWHAQQRPKYLNSLLADKPKPVDPNSGKKNKYIAYTAPAAANNWDKQALYDLPTPLQQGVTYTLSVKVKGKDSDGVVGLWPIWNASDNKNEWGGSNDLQYLAENPVAKEWTTIKWTWEAAFPEDCLQLVFGKFDGAICFDDLVLTAAGSEENLIACGNFEDGAMTGWRNNWNGPSFAVEEEVLGESNVEYVTVFTNAITNSAMEAGQSTDCFVVRDATSADDHPAEIIVGEGPNGANCIKVVGKTNPAEEWDTQFFIYTPSKKWEAGEKYKLSMWVKATKEIGTDSQVHSTPGNYKHWAMLSPNPTFTTEWKKLEWESTIPAEGGGEQQTIAFNLNKNKSSDPGTQITYYFSGIEWYYGEEKEVPKMEIVVVDYVNNSDMEGDEAANFVRKENNGAFETVIEDGVGVNGSRGVKVLSKAGASEDWDSQFWIKLNEPLAEGTVVNVKFDYKASVPANADTQAHGAPGAYQHWACIGSPAFTTEWQTYSKVLTVDASMAGGNGLGSIAFNLSKDRGQDVTYYFDNIRVWSEVEQEVKSTIPLTPEEKHDTLVWAMDKWIAGMMEACEGHVKAWDVVNEAIAGDGNDGGFYTLQHGSADNANDFFWQDGMGDLEYVRQAVRLARKYYAKSLEEKGGDDGQLKLFINDYNLESDWDNNHKVKSLINWIKRWEEDGVTKIDGIGTQMHISYYEDAKTLESKKNAIVNSFKLMAATGKLVRISELDMGYVKKDGKDATLDEMTDDMEKQMEEYYKWIIEQYFANVPANQQYGITQWCLTDSPKGSGWRADTPVGIWDLNWNRKYIYRGWTEGLAK